MSGTILYLYTDIDTLFDTRRGIIEKVGRLAKGNAFQWSDYAPIYRSRNIDYFDMPELGITPDAYAEHFAKRSTDDWVDVEKNICYFYQTGISCSMLPVVRAIQIGSNNVINLSAIHLTVNTYPFILTDALKNALIENITNQFSVRISVTLDYVAFDNQTADYINRFNFVFRYGHLVNPEFKIWFDTYATSRVQGTKIIVPALLARLPEADPLLKEMNNDSASRRIEKMSSIQGGKVIFIPLSVSVFDYAT